ncbi:hypothetical protein [Klebsiella quasipneumoniae]|uniref:hypothetical protein n=1 Tax=Klebsiella quasipneumoniae TaxID=1463165 RepID=UPI00081C1FE8|nr:hypothetical protein [Klebsiella quasipneumoniae]OCV55739.1 hypothetical protein A9P88_10515 [Klebsiella quasipneumoniae subsp. similipneumoniae]GKP57909.1 hypothetical protein NUKP47_01920 [Klebsiella quasipneumoniae]
MKKENEKVWSELARVPRRSYLGKYRRLTPSQNRWVRSLLNHWGSVFGGSGTEHLSGGGGMWSMIITGWTGEQQEKITDVLARLRKMGYEGAKLIVMAKALLWPKKSLSDIIGNAIDQDEADFMEAIILKAFPKETMIYTIGKNYYKSRQPMVDMARWMQYHYAPFLTEKQCIDRVRWCVELFNSAVYFTLCAELSIENEVNVKKDLKISFETA